MLYFFGASINIFLVLLLISKKGKTPADKILACWLAIIAFHLSLYIMHLQPIENAIPHLLGVAAILPIVHGPMLYLYTASATRRLPSGKKWFLLHWVLPIISFIYLSPFYFSSAEEKIYIYRNNGAGYEKQVFFNSVSLIISGIVYVIWCLVLLKNHRRNIANQFSNDEKISLNWLRYLIYGIGFIWLFITINAGDTIIFSLVSVYVILLGYFGIRQGKIFNTTHLAVSVNEKVKTGEEQQIKMYNPAESVVQTDTPALPIAEPGFKNIQLPLLNTDINDEQPYQPKKKYAKSGLTEETAFSVHSALQKLMTTEKLYKEPDLTLVKLAGILNIHPNYLSQIINEKEGKNFYDYINTLRIEEVKQMLSVPENAKYTIMSLAYDCGFNSKSSFNKNFKRVTGVSPSAFVNSNF